MTRNLYPIAHEGSSLLAWAQGLGFGLWQERVDEKD